jgi:hypothetical protein
MFRSLNTPALLFTYGMCMFLAIFAGYLLADPLQLTSLGALSLILLLPLVPLLLRWHHEMLIITLNSFFIVFFLPGQPSLGVLIALFSLFISIVNRTMGRENRFLSIPSLTFPLLLLLVVVVVTAYLTGGMGARSLGSATFGGKRYMMLIGGIVAYFALTAKVIPPERRLLMASLFFLAGLTGAISDLIYAAGPGFYFLYVVFSANLASMQAVSESWARYSGLTWGFMAFCYFLFLRFGIRGLFDMTQPWRALLFMLALGISLMGGFRSTLIILGLLFSFQFYFEGLVRSYLFPALVGVGLIVGSVTILALDKLPMAVHRSLSFLPLDINPVAKHDAMTTLDWRFQIWKTVVPEVPNYLLIGKGFSFSGTDLYLTQEAVKRGVVRLYEETLISGEYHNGLLTTVIPFGLAGLLILFWFFGAALRVLYRNYLYGEEEMQRINTFLLAYFCTRMVFFIFFYGQLELDLLVFTGTVGMSVALNGGMRGPESLEESGEPAYSTRVPDALMLRPRAQ